MRATLALALLIQLPATTAWELVSSDVVLRCRQPELQILDCDYRSPAGADPDISMSNATGAVPPKERRPFPWLQAKSAVLLLVDTSDPGRAGIVEQNSRQIIALTRVLRPHHKLGLARFDKEIEVLAPLGSSIEAISGAAPRLRAAGMTTELYRNLIRAVEILAATEADRRFIVLFSDGQAEDTAYFHDDVVKAADNAGISIMSLGFPRTIARSVALQSLRRLSEDTGGLYLESDLGGVLTDGFERHLIASMDNGANIVFSLPTSGGVGEPATAALIVRTGAGVSQVTVPLRLPPTPKSVPAGRPASNALPSVNPTQAVVAPAPARSADRWFWYSVPAALTILILLALTTLYLLFRRPGKLSGAPHSAMPVLKPFAYLISQTSQPKRFAITNAIWRIGRSRENELVLDDVSISRRHAEIQRGPDGAFTILDRGARNGTYVNGQQVKKRTLQEGDMIEVGDIVLRFTETGVDDQLQEQTAIQHTRQPRTG